MKIDIIKISGKKIVTRGDGEKINDILTAKWNAEKIINIDFDNVLVASVSFMDEAFGKLALKYDREDLKKEFYSFSYKDYLRNAINFFECYRNIRGLLPGIKGFMFDKNQVRFVVDGSVDEDKKKEIREAFVGFVDFGQIVERIKRKRDNK